ncbi:MAG: HPF/RaiA family ribosome-associated protein [Candidatus Diapherotrites archaeon]|nr:HPF/RaiA family ribosome-associated protein [Candidatus Diapherotrites archaeon]
MDKNSLNIVLDGFNDVENSVRESVLLKAEVFCNKIEEKLKNKCNLHIHIKKHKHGDKGRIKYEVKTKLTTGGVFFEATEFDWDLKKAFYKCLEILERNIRERSFK